MKGNRSWIQVVVVVGSVLLFCFLYFAGRTSPKGQDQVEKSRALASESMEVSELFDRAQTAYTTDQLSSILPLERILQTESDTLKRVETLKSLSKGWNDLNNFALGGHYAEQAAMELETSEEAWSIAGSTFAICFQRPTDDKERSYCVDHAIRSFENAVSLNPANDTNRVNLGLCYVNGSNEPMKGILKIRDLADAGSTSPFVYFTLGRLSMQSGQFDKAVSRFEQALELDPENGDAHWLLADAYQNLGDINKTKSHLEMALLKVKDPNKRKQIQTTLTSLND